MKKVIIAALMLVASVSAFSQAKKPAQDTVKRAKYEYFIRVPVQDYQQLIGIADNYQKQVKYNPLIDDASKIAVQTNIEKFLFDLTRSVKADSAAVAGASKEQIKK